MDDEGSGDQEYIVYGTVTFRGAYITVRARDPDEALDKVQLGGGDGDWDISGAELSDWKVSKAEPNK